MKTLIAYSGKYGATQACASRIADKLQGTVDVVNLDTKKDIDLAPYDRVVVGCSVYMGKPRKAAQQFCKRNLATLLEKEVGLYLCCIQDLEKTVNQQFELAYPQQLLHHARVYTQLGGVVDFTKLKPLDKFIMNMIAGDLRKKTKSDVITTVSEDRINFFCKQLTTPAPAK